ncbi:actin-domain-containing protein, partial [Endogone sp. FLAS-F59071]
PPTHTHTSLPHTSPPALLNPSHFCSLVPNCITRGKGDRRTFVGDQLSTCRDYSGLYYRLPFEKNLLKRRFAGERRANLRLSLESGRFVVIGTMTPCLRFRVRVRVPVPVPVPVPVVSVPTFCEPEECGLVVTEPCFNLPNIQQTYDQIVFEEYEFESCYRTTAPQLCLHNDIPSLFGDTRAHLPDCVVIVDSGYSFTHIVPFLKGKPIAKAIRRISVGGKLLTNQLKEVVSFRYYNMMDETYLMNEVKEACCYVSQDVFKDLDLCKKGLKDNSIIQEYVLPDFSSNTKGYIKPRPTGKSALSTNLLSATSDQQVLLMNNERFTIPEILLHPSDIGMHQAGIPETIVQSVTACDEALHGLMYSNVVLVGGNVQLPGFRERVETDLRNLAPADFEVRVAKPKNPVTYAWQGGTRLAASQKSAEYIKKAVTRQEYQEVGSEACRRKFGGL